MAFALVLTMVMTACNGKNSDISDKDAAAIDAYVEMNNSPASKAAVEQSGLFTSYKCFRDGYDIIIEFHFIPGVDLSQTTEADFNRDLTQVIDPLRNDYRTLPVAKDAFDIMKRNGGSFIYRYFDSNGVSRTINLPAADV